MITGVVVPFATVLDRSVPVVPRVIAATLVTVPLVAGAAQDGAPLVVAVKTCPVVPLAIPANPVPALLPV